MSSRFKLSVPHVFKFAERAVGCVEVKDFTCSEELDSLTLLKKSVSVDVIQTSWTRLKQGEDFKVKTLGQ